MAMAGKIQPEPPTQAEIAAACLAIQATWTPEERVKRLRDLTTRHGQHQAVAF